MRFLSAPGTLPSFLRTRYTDCMPLPAAAIASLPAPKIPDAWEALFAHRETSPECLAQLLVAEQVDPAYRTASGVSLLHAFLSRWRFDPGTGLVSDYLARQAIPVDSNQPWDPVNHVTSSVLTGLLLGSGLDPFEPDPSGSAVDTLDVALGQGWDEVVIHCLRAPSCPDVAALNARTSPLLLTKDKARLPWPHALANAGRAKALAAWLARPGMDPDLLDHHGRSPLFYATHPDVVNVLLAAGARTDVKARDGRTASDTWANPPSGTLYQTASVSSRAAMDAAVATASSSSVPLSPSYENWIHGQDADRLLAETSSEELAGARIRRVVGSETVEWGFVGFLAWSWMSLHSLKYSTRIEGAGPVLRGLVKILPPHAWTHESLPGVRDGDLLRLGLCAIDPLRTNEKYELAALLETIHVSSPLALSAARLSVLPYLRGDGRAHQADELAKELKGWATTRTPGELESDASAWLDVGAAAIRSRWMRDRMGGVALALVANPHRSVHLEGHAQAKDWLRAAMLEFSAFAATQKKRSNHINVDKAALLAETKAIETGLFATLDACATRGSVPMTVVDDVVLRAQKSTPEFAARLQAWSLATTALPDVAVPSRPSRSLRL